MAVPDFQSVMLPLLKIMGDGREHTYQDLFDQLAGHFKLSEADREELLPSGTQSRFVNRVRWACNYVRRAGLINSVARGRFQISARGSELLRKPPSKIDIKYLSAFEEFREFRQTARQDESAIQAAAATDESEGLQTPEELLDACYQQLRRQLAQDLLEKLLVCSPSFFESLVVHLLVAMGYGGSLKDAGKVVGKSGDGGIDGIIKEDKLGLDVVYVQAKRWKNPVDRPTVQGFAGSLEGHRARKGVIITTSTFTDGATEYVRMIEKKIVLIEGVELAQLMIDHGVGVADVRTYTVKRLDSDYFDED